MKVIFISMKLKIYQIDTFANKIFEENLAAVIPLDQWLPNEVMQSIAQENNLLETTFFVNRLKNLTSNGYHLVRRQDYVAMLL